LSTEQELQRQFGINLQLRRKLETARRDAVEECAKFCEGKEAGMVYGEGRGWTLAPRSSTYGTHPGDAYAKGLREMIGK